MASLHGARHPWWSGWFRFWCVVQAADLAWLFLGGSGAALALLAGLQGVFGLGIAWPHWRFFGRVVTDCGDASKIALTFDDGPDPDMTPKVLERLKAHGFKATFFLVGQNVRKHPELARRIVAEGHCVGTHSYDHSVFSNFRLTAAARRDLQASRAAFREVLGIDPHLHRPPVGLTNPHLFQALRQEGMTCVCWNRAGRDGGNRRPEGIARIGALAAPGAIVCLHDVLPRPEHEAEVLAQLDRLLADIARRNLETIRLDAIPGLGTDANPDKTVV